MDSSTVFDIVVFAVFLFILIGLLVNATLNSRPIYPKQSQGFEAIEKAIDKYDREWPSNNCGSLYAPYHRVRRTMNRRASWRNRASKPSDTRSR